MGQEPTQPKPEGNAGTGMSDKCECTTITLGFGLACVPCQYKEYELLLEEVADILEGGDVVHDLYSIPSAATTISIVADTVNNALKGIRAIRDMQNGLREIQ